MVRRILRGCGRADAAGSAVEPALSSAAFVAADDSCSLSADSRSVERLVAAVDLVVVPVQPSPLDLWSGEDMAALIRKAQSVHPALKSRMLITRRLANTTLGREAREAAGAFGIPVFDTEIGQRVALAESLVAGQTVFDYAPGSPAVDEFQRLRVELVKALATGLARMASAS